MSNNIYIYEDEQYKNFFPFVYLRPVFDLYCGMYTFKERIERLYPEAKIHYLSRFQPTIQLSDQPTLFINGRAILNQKLSIENNEEIIFTSGNEIVGFKTQKLELPVRDEFLNSLKKELKQIEVKSTVIKYLWHLIKENRKVIADDFGLWGKGENGLYIDREARVDDGVFLNTENGPIYIGKGARIRPPTIIDGPCYIGSRTIVDGAKIRPGTTIGNVCRIGGEVENSIFCDYSNKHHEGYVGHSIIGEWVNLGALTTTSNLKNTYGTVKVPVNGQEIDSELLKVGAFIGDHVKTGIGSLLTTGCVIGCFANIYGGGTFPKSVPSFAWGTPEKLGTYSLEKAIEVTKRMMERRRVTVTQEYIERIKQAFELSQKERSK